MEFRDSGAEVAGNPNLFQNRLALLIGGLVLLGMIGVCVLLLFVFGVLPPGRRTTATTAKTAQATATQVAVVQATVASTPTAPVQVTSTAAPTFTAPAPVQTSVVVPTATAPVATLGAAKPGATAMPAVKAPANPFAGIYVSQLSVNPAYPRKNEPITFNLVLSNTTGQSQHYNVCVEAFRPGDKKSFGITYCPRQTIPPGTNGLVSGEWTVTGIRECIPVRARPVVKDEGSLYIPLQQSNGSDLWLEFQVCP